LLISPFFHPTSSSTTYHENFRNQIGALYGERAVTMVVSEATRARTWKDKTPTVNTSAPPEVQDASERSRANPRLANPHIPEREAHVIVNALKHFMTVMTDTITQRVSE